ncbi:3-phosphoshikimate 1-carboxyvinyltransferase [Abeliophyllum distichum]|uniref:3-phosphoshikimate 1-carboxyvinyltransferase n=1 Tax=Abeliophyllum distichum TaxID=126358 RepID=A0ABD1RII5_9LAMI
MMRVWSHRIVELVIRFRHNALPISTKVTTLRALLHSFVPEFESEPETEPVHILLLDSINRKIHLKNNLGLFLLAQKVCSDIQCDSSSRTKMLRILYGGGRQYSFFSLISSVHYGERQNARYNLGLLLRERDDDLAGWR